MSVSSSRRRYLSVWLRRLATDRLIRGRAHAAHVGGSRFAQENERPLVVAEPVKGALRLYAVNDAAARLGLRPGLGLADARAMYPRIAVADADHAADARTLEAIADWCDRYTPLVGLDPPDGLLLDITGCAHLFGGEEAMRRDIVARLARQGFHTRAAVADTVGCAWAVARYGDFDFEDADTSSEDNANAYVRLNRCRATASPPPERGRDRVRVASPRVDPLPTPPPFRGREQAASSRALVPSSQTQAVLLPFPLAALRIDSETVTALAQVGLKCIADVIDRPRAPLAARFGEDFVRRLDQAIGREDEPITPRLPVPSYVVERRFAEPIAREEDVLGAIASLAQELARLLEQRGEGARTIEAALFRTDGKVHRIAAGAAAPLREPKRIRALFVERLAAVGDACDPGFGYDVVRLCALAAERSDPQQTGLAAPDHAAELAHLVDRLGARFGLRRVTRLIPQDTHIPEFAVTAVAAVSAMHRGSHAIPSLEWRRAAPHRPLPRLRGRDREGADEHGHAVTPSPHPSPSERAFTPVFDGLCGRGSRPHSPQRQGSISFREQDSFRREPDPFRREQDSFRTEQDSFRAQDSLAPVRPIRLFEKPELIKATAEVPDGPPKQFIWRQVLYVVTHAEGPERIAMEWWRDEQGRRLTRDYFRVESKEGIRAWLYRDGPYIAETEQPQWYLHGLCA